MSEDARFEDGEDKALNMAPLIKVTGNCFISYSRLNSSGQ